MYAFCVFTTSSDALDQGDLMAATTEVAEALQIRDPDAGWRTASHRFISPECAKTLPVGAANLSSSWYDRGRSPKVSGTLNLNAS